MVSHSAPTLPPHLPGKHAFLSHGQEGEEVPTYREMVKEAIHSYNNLRGSTKTDISEVCGYY